MQIEYIIALNFQFDVINAEHVYYRRTLCSHSECENKKSNQQFKEKTAN